METSEFLGALAFISLASILFTPVDSKTWVYFLVFGIIFGIGYIVKK